jgi:hypothetical protein
LSQDTRPVRAIERDPTRQDVGMVARDFQIFYRSNPVNLAVEARGGIRRAPAPIAAKLRVWASRALT